MKTPEELAEEYADVCVSDAGYATSKAGFLAGYKEGFQAGCIKGSMAMQSTLDSDYHLTPIIDHEKLARRMTEKELKKKEKANENT
jgi:hypothetical protein